MDNEELERLLTAIYSDDDEEITVLFAPLRPIFPFLSCCVYSYAGYNS